MFARKKQPLIKSLIAQNSKIEGSLCFTDGLRVDGEVTGDIQAGAGQRSLLVISESARVNGKVRACHVIINGTVCGPVYADELLELQPKADIRGDVYYKALEMHQGAVISGQLQPLAQPEEEKPMLKLATSNG